MKVDDLGLLLLGVTQEDEEGAVVLCDGLREKGGDPRVELFTHCGEEGYYFRKGKDRVTEV